MSGFRLHLTVIISEKVNLFFCENISRMTRTYKEIESNFNMIKSSSDSDKKKAVADMKFAVSETYLMMKKIEVYQTLNHTGFRKICKKHDKILVRNTGKAFMSDVIDQAAFWTDKNLKRRINGLEEMMTGLEGGDMKKAMERLRRVFILILKSDWSKVKPLSINHLQKENHKKSTTDEGTYSK